MALTLAQFKADNNIVGKLQFFKSKKSNRRVATVKAGIMLVTTEDFNPAFALAAYVYENPTAEAGTCYILSNNTGTPDFEL